MKKDIKQIIQKYNDEFLEVEKYFYFSLFHWKVGVKFNV